MSNNLFSEINPQQESTLSGGYYGGCWYKPCQPKHKCDYKPAVEPSCGQKYDYKPAVEPCGYKFTAKY